MLCAKGWAEEMDEQKEAKPLGRKEKKKAEDPQPSCSPALEHPYHMACTFLMAPLDLLPYVAHS